MAHTREELIVELVQDMLMVIALYTSVFDVPNLVCVNKFFASQSDVLWRYHAWRIYQLSPQSVLPAANLEKPLTSWHDRFFIKYNDTHYMFKSNHNKNYIRRGLQISEGRVKDFIDEYYNGIPVKNNGGEIHVVEDSYISIYALFGEDSPFSHDVKATLSYHLKLSKTYANSQHRPALLGLAQQLPEKERKCVLDFFYKEVVLPYCEEEYRKYIRQRSIFITLFSPEELREIVLRTPNVYLLRYALEFKALKCNQLTSLCRMLINREPILFSLIEQSEMELVLYILKYDANVNKTLLIENIFQSIFDTFCKSFDPQSVWLERLPIDKKTSKAEKDLWFYCRDKFPKEYSSAIAKISANPEKLTVLSELESPIQDEISQDSIMDFHKYKI